MSGQKNPDQTRSFRVWDPLVRVFHWSLVGLFTANALILDTEGAAHVWVGYAVLGLIAFRLLWGLIGSRSARFATFAPGVAQLRDHARDLMTGRHPVHLNHTPLGALMIFNLLLTLALIGLSGYMLTSNAYWGVRWVEQLHEALVTWAEISIVLHVGAVVYESLRSKVNLPRAMITGVKRLPAGVLPVDEP